MAISGLAHPRCLWHALCNYFYRNVMLRHGLIGGLPDRVVFPSQDPTITHPKGNGIEPAQGGFL